MNARAVGAARRLSAVALVVTIAVGLSGCVSGETVTRPEPTGRAIPNTVTPVSPLALPSVLAYCPREDAVHDDEYALPTDEVYICRADGTHDTDGTTSYGPWESASRVRDPAALLAAYRVADARRSRRLCASAVHDPLIIWVHRTGVTRAYYAPVDTCGNPSPAATAAYQDATRILLVDVDRGAPRSSLKDPNG